MTIRNALFYLLFMALAYYMLWIFDPVLGFCYDTLTNQPTIEKRASIDQVLSELEQLPFEDLAPSIQERFSTEETKVCYGKSKDQLYVGKIVYKLSWFQRYRYIVGDYRFRDFFSGSEFFINSSGFPHLAKNQYIVMDKALLYKILALRQALQNQGYDADEIAINSGFRTPFYNEAVGGKVCSRHQMGDAVDIYVYDINRDFEANMTDAKIVFDILETEIIQSEGGLGKYKSNTNVLHFDTRGFRARWHY